MFTDLFQMMEAVDKLSDEWRERSHVTRCSIKRSLRIISL